MFIVHCNNLNTGAHTLGRARPESSGFRGPWVRRGQDLLNNAFYRELLNVGQWTQVRSPKVYKKLLKVYNT